MEKVIPLRLVHSSPSPLSARGLTSDEAEVAEQLLQVLRRGTSEQKTVLRQTIMVHFNTLPGEIWAE